MLLSAESSAQLVQNLCSGHSRSTWRLNIPEDSKAHRSLLVGGCYVLIPQLLQHLEVGGSLRGFSLNISCSFAQMNRMLRCHKESAWCIWCSDVIRNQPLSIPIEIMNWQSGHSFLVTRDCSTGGTIFPSGTILGDVPTPIDDEITFCPHSSLTSSVLTFFSFTTPLPNSTMVMS